MLRKRKFQETSPTPSTPQYAILKLKPDTDCVLLLQHALSLGVADISFVSHPREYFKSCERFAVSPSPSPSREPQYEPSTVPVTAKPSNGTSTIRNNGTNGEVAAKLDHNDVISDKHQQQQQHDINSVLCSLFGNATDPAAVFRSINPLMQEPPRSSSPPPIIPGNGQILCKLCGIGISCRKITNLSIHTLKLHCPIPLWRCSSAGCDFDHADFGRVRSHIRHHHNSLDGPPVDMRTEDSVQEATKYLKFCYPSVDFDKQHSRVIYMTEPPPIADKSSKDRTDQLMGWDQHVINDKNINSIVECSSCQSEVKLTKKHVEDHIKASHYAEKLFQCPLCEYAYPDEWRARVHATIRHPDKQLRTFPSITVGLKPHLYIRKLFPTIAELLPNDEVENLLGTLNMEEESINTDQTASTIEDAPASQPEAEPSKISSDEDSAVQNILLQMFPSLTSSTPSSAVPTRSSSSTMNRIERVMGKVDCRLCSAAVESKRTMLVAHAKSHCSQRQWQCPHCETSAAFHSKLKLHIVNAHKSDAEPLDHYSPELENKWLILFRHCFPQYAQQCFVEEWKFRSKQQQHYTSQLDDSWNRGLDGAEPPRRSLLVEDNPQINFDEMPDIRIPIIVKQDDNNS